MYTPAERIFTSQNLLRREYPDGDLDLMLPEVEEVIHLETEQLHTIREAYLTDFEDARAGRSFLFQYLATYEVWYRMTRWVLGQPTPRYVPPDYAASQQKQLDWAREYALSREVYAPYTPFIVEEWRVAYQLPAALGDQIAQEIADRSPRVIGRAADREVTRPWGAGCQPQALSLVVQQADGLCSCGQHDKPPYLNEAHMTAARREGLLVFLS